MRSNKRRAEDPLLPVRAPKVPKTSQAHPDGGNSSPTQYIGLTARWVVNATVIALRTFRPYFTMVKAKLNTLAPPPSPPQQAPAPVAAVPQQPAADAQEDRAPAGSLPSPSPSPHTSPNMSSRSLVHAEAGPSRQPTPSRTTQTHSDASVEQPQSSQPADSRHSKHAKEPLMASAVAGPSTRIERSHRPTTSLEPQAPRAGPSNENQGSSRDHQEARAVQTQHRKHAREHHRTPPPRDGQVSDEREHPVVSDRAGSFGCKGKECNVGQHSKAGRADAGGTKRAGVPPPRASQSALAVGNQESRTSRGHSEAGPSTLPRSILPRKDALAQQTQPAVADAEPQSTTTRVPTRSTLGLPTPPTTQASSQSSASAEIAAIARDHPVVGEALAKYSHSKSPSVSPVKRQPYKSRDHIHMKRFKRTVKQQILEGKEAMEKHLYRARQARGFSSDFESFQSLLRYQELLDRNINEKPPTRGKVFAERPVTETKPDFLQRAFARAKETLQTPPPKPYAPATPALDRIRSARRVRDVAIEEKLHPAKRLPSSLPPEDEELVNKLLSRSGVVSKCVHQQVTGADLQLLRPLTWLNDEIINFYGQMLMNRAEENKENPQNGKKPLKIHYFNSFFWEKLTSEGYDKGRLAKWTKKIDLFSKDVVLIPINHNQRHWTAAAINFRKKRIESHDSLEKPRPYVFETLRTYLDAEHRNKKNTPFDFSGWEDYTMPNLPQQENGYDCGVFTCQFLESLSRGEDEFVFRQSDIPYLRRKMIWEIGKVKLRDDY